MFSNETDDQMTLERAAGSFQRAFPQEAVVRRTEGMEKQQARPPVRLEET